MLLAEQHEVDGGLTCARGPSTWYVRGAAVMKMHALGERFHEHERCTVGGGNWQSSREATRTRSWHSVLASPGSVALSIEVRDRFTSQPSVRLWHLTYSQLDSWSSASNVEALWSQSLAKVTGPAESRT